MPLGQMAFIEACEAIRVGRRNARLTHGGAVSAALRRGPADDFKDGRTRRVVYEAGDEPPARAAASNGGRQQSHPREERGPARSEVSDNTGNRQARENVAKAFTPDGACSGRLGARTRGRRAETRWQYPSSTQSPATGWRRSAQPIRKAAAAKRTSSQWHRILARKRIFASSKTRRSIRGDRIASRAKRKLAARKYPA